MDKIEELRRLVENFEVSSYEKDRALTLINDLRRDLKPSTTLEAATQQQQWAHHDSIFTTGTGLPLSFDKPDSTLAKLDLFALGSLAPVTISVCIAFVAVGHVSPHWLRERQILVIGRAIFFLGHVLAYTLYTRVIWRVDNSYTSYRGGNDYGYTNVEKAEIRAEVTRIWRLLLFRAIVAGIVHYQFLSWVTPLLITSTLGYGTLLNNQHYVHIFWNPYKLKKPEGFVPRSTSGRLL